MARVAVCGFGAMGSEIFKYLLNRKHEVTRVIDSDPAKAGRTVREVTGFESEVRIRHSVKEAEIDSIDVVVFSTSQSRQMTERWGSRSCLSSNHCPPFPC